LASCGSRTVSLPLRLAASFTFTVLVPYLTVTVPFGRDSPEALTRTTTFARLPTFTLEAFAVTFGLPLATFFDDDDATPSACPATLPVTRTDTRLPTSAVVSVYLADVAPLIALLPRNHWYSATTPGRSQAPAEARRVDPSRAEPETLGLVLARAAGSVGTRAAESVATPAVNPSFDAVTRTVMAVPRSAREIT